MAKVTGGALVVRALKKQGISQVFTLTGLHLWPILDACPEEGMRVIDVRHEQAAAFAADGWARITGKVGVAVVTAGPGVTNAVTGIANAYQAGSPVLILGGHSSIDTFDRAPLQEMDHVTLVRSITKWAGVVYETKRIPEYIDTAFRYALAGRPGPSFLACPEDILRGEVEEEEMLFAEPEQTRGIARVPGNPELVRKASQLLAQAHRPAVVVGSAIFWSQATRELQEFAEKLQAPFFLSAFGRGCLPPEHSLLFTASRRFALGQADVILVLGAPLDFRLNYGQPPLFPPEARVIQVDMDPAELGHNRPVDMAILGDVGEVLRQFIAELPAKRSSHTTGWLKMVREEEQRKEQLSLALLHSEQVPIHPFRVYREIRDLVDKEATIIGDGGDFVTMAAQVLRPPLPGYWLDTGKLGCLGVGTGFALAARLARPEKPVLIIQGDGSFGFNCMEYDTAIRHSLPFVSVIGNNGRWGAGEAPASRKSLLRFARYEKVVEALGGYGEYVERPEQIRPALERALAAGVPAAVNVIIDPFATLP